MSLTNYENQIHRLDEDDAADWADHWTFDTDEHGPFIWKENYCPYDMPYWEPQSSFL